MGLPVYENAGEFDGPLILTAAHCVGGLSRGYPAETHVLGAESALGRPGGALDYYVGEVVRDGARASRDLL